MMTDPQRPPPGEGHAPPIPDKLYFRIGEVAALCRVPGYVLRFWQTEFPQLRPGKSGTGQRLYRRRDVEMALRIKRLLHDEGYTIAGARGVLAAKTTVPARPHPHPEPPAPPAPTRESSERVPAQFASLAHVRAELRELLHLLDRKPLASAGVPEPPANPTTPKPRLLPHKPPPA